MLGQIKKDYELSGRNVAACMTVDKVNWLIAEVERLQKRLIDCELTLSRLAFASPPPPQGAAVYFRRYPICEKEGES